MVIAGSSIDDIYIKLCQALCDYGETVEARGLETRELLDVRLQLMNPEHRFIGSIARAMDMRYCIGELCFFLDGRTDLESIAHYSSFWKRVSDDGLTVNSAYGERLFEHRNRANVSQFWYVIDTLIQDPNSRKAVMVIYTPEDAKPSNDNPCTMFLQFVVRHNRLHCYTTMRSNDVWLGVPYDIAFFTLLQEMVMLRLRPHYPTLQLGTYNHAVTSMHMYARDYEGVFKVSKEVAPPALIAPRLTDSDVHTWFDDLLTYEKAYRGKVLYKNSGPRTAFQDWCKDWLV